MKELKVIFSIVGLISIGFIGGFFTHRYVATKKIDKVRELAMAKGFQDHLFRMIDPTPEQREQLEPIVEKYAKDMSVVVRDSRDKRKTLMDSLHKNIRPHLTEDQIQHLDEFSRRFRERARRERGLRGKKHDHRKKNRPPREKTPE